MSGFFVFIFLVALIALPVALIKPSFITRGLTNSRKIALLGIAAVLILSFVMIGVSSEPIENETSNAKEIEEQVTETTPVKKISPTIKNIAEEESITPTPSRRPTQTVRQLTPTPTKFVVPPTATPTQFYSPTQAPPAGGGGSCNCAKTCTQISSCQEAYFQLNECGCSVRDGDNDGVPCENLCE